MKRLLSLLISVTVCAALLLSGCDRREGVAYDPAAYADRFAAAWRYRTLEEPLKSAYGALYTAVTDTCFAADHRFIRDGEAVPGVCVILPTPLADATQVSALYEAFTADNPAFFFLSNTYIYSGDKDGFDTLYLFYTAESDARRAAADALEGRVAALLAGLPDGDGYTKEKYLHDALVGGCVYDTALAAALPHDAFGYTAYGALVGGKAVCEGYARAMQLLLSRVGIAATTVTGTLKEGGTVHMWNVVALDGECYHLDPTWNGTGDRVGHLYFNLTDEAIARTRTVKETVADCSAERDNYFRREGRYIDTFERAAVAGVVAEALRAGERTVDLSFAPDKYASGALLITEESLFLSMLRERLPAGEAPDGYGLTGKPEEYTLTLLF